MNFLSRVRTPLDPNLARINQWLTVEQFGYERRRDYCAVLHLLAKVDDELRVPAGATLFVQNDALRRGYAPLASSSAPCSFRGGRLLRSRSELLWQVEFAVSLAVVEYPDAVFSLAADGRLPVVLPAPYLLRDDTHGPNRSVLGGATTIRRHLAALAAGFAVAAAPGFTAGVADAGTITHAKLHKPTIAKPHKPSTVVLHNPAGGNNVTSDPTPGPAQPLTTTIVTTTTAGVNAHAPQAASVLHKHPATWTATHSVAAATPPPGTAHHYRHRGHGHHNHPWWRVTAPGPQITGPHHKTSKPGAHKPHPALPQHATALPQHATAPPQHSTSHPRHHLSGRAVVLSAPATEPAQFTAPQPVLPSAPASTANPDNPTTLASWLGQPTGSPAWPAGLNPNAFANAAASQTSSLLATGNQPPAFLIPIYKAAAKRYHVPWQILAAINWIETDYGTNLNTSSAGAIGWMQFMPATWQQYGVAADGHSPPNPNNPQDAIFSAAHYLAANGAAQNLPKAIFAYNHAAWYVAEVIWRAQLISDHAGASADRSLAGTGNTGLAGAETMLVAAFSAVGGPYSQANHDSFGQTAADLRRAGTDCSGFVSWVLDQVDPGFGSQTTVTLPAQPGIQPGVGQYVTMWDRPLPGNQGHVIINILGTWFESGGNTAYNPAGGISPLSEGQAVGELTGGGFLPYHLKGL